MSFCGVSHSCSVEKSVHLFLLLGVMVFVCMMVFYFKALISKNQHQRSEMQSRGALCLS